MRRGYAVMLAAAALLLVAIPSSGQEGPKSPEPAKGGSGISATVIQTDGAKSELADILLEEEKLGIMSMTRVPTHTFRMKFGKADLKISLLKIQRIDLVAGTVRVTGKAGELTEGAIDPDSTHFLVGKMGLADFSISLKDIKTVTFTHPNEKPMRCPSASCNRLYNEPEWRYCPFDGSRLKASE